MFGSSWIAAARSRSWSACFISGDCDAGGSVTVVAGETAHCTITNTRISPATTLAVNKVCFPAGDDGHFKVGIFRIDGRPVPRAVLACHGTTGALGLHPGTYVVRERGADGTDLSDYNRSVAGDCLSNGTVTLEAGDHARCRIVNVRRATPPPAELTVTKICVPADDGGRFDLTVDGETQADVACGESFGPVAVPAGQHHVLESAGTGTSLSDYTTTIGGACAADGSVTLAAGQQATCTVTNVRTGTSPPEPPDETGTVAIEKRCAPAGTTGTFQLQLDGHIFQLGCGESTGSVVVPAGDHQIGEVAVGRVTSRFRTTIGGDCAPSGRRRARHVRRHQHARATRATSEATIRLLHALGSAADGDGGQAPSRGRPGAPRSDRGRGRSGVPPGSGGVRRPGDEQERARTVRGDASPPRGPAGVDPEGVRLPEASAQEDRRRRRGHSACHRLTLAPESAPCPSI